MTDATTDFFTDLSRRGHEPLLAMVTGTLRFDIVRGQRTDHRFVAITKGNIVVSEENADADTVVRTDLAVLDGIARGETNAMAATLRGAITFQGDPQLFVRFQRLFPGPARSRDRATGGHSQEGEQP